MNMIMNKFNFKENLVDKTIYNSFEQELIDNGYRIFSSSIKSAIRGFQKRFDDDFGKKYFITIWHYNLKKQHPEFTTAPAGDSYTFDLQFRLNKRKKEITVDLDIWGKVLPDEYEGEIITLNEMEEFIEKTWINFGKPYYESWRES